MCVSYSPSIDVVVNRISLSLCVVLYIKLQTYTHVFRHTPPHHTSRTREKKTRYIYVPQNDDLWMVRTTHPIFGNHIGVGAKPYAHKWFIKNNDSHARVWMVVVNNAPVCMMGMGPPTTNKPPPRQMEVFRSNAPNRQLGFILSFCICICYAHQICWIMRTIYFM